MCFKLTKVCSVTKQPNKHTMFKTPLLKYTQTLLKTIALDYNLPIEELVIKYCEQSDAPKVPCPHKTGKGSPCKNSCLPGENHCRLHAVVKPEKPVKIKKVKPVKLQPSHSHSIGVCDSSCQLCKTHGDAFNASFQQFVVSLPQTLEEATDHTNDASDHKSVE